MSSARISFLLQVENDSEVKARFEAVGGSIEQLGKKTDRAAESAGKVLKRYGDAATGLIDVADKAFSLYTQFDGLEKAQLRVEKAQKSHEQATLQLSRAQHALGELVNGGAESAMEYESALASVALAKEKERLASEGATQAQQDLAESQIQFALGVVPQVIGMASSASSALAALGFSSAGAGAGATAGAGGMATLRASIMALWTALGPVGWAVIGIGAIFTAVSVNAFGFRDALNSIGKAIGDALSLLRPLLDILGGISKWMEDMQGPAAGAAGSVGEFASRAEISLGRAETAMVSLAGAMQGGAESIEAAAGQVQTFAGYMQELADSAEEAGRENLYFVQSTGAVADASSLSNAQLELAAGFLRAQQSETERLTQENFGLVASHTSLQQALSLTNAAAGDYGTGTEVVVLAESADERYPEFWRELGSTPLGSAADDLDVTSFAAKKYLMIEAHLIASSAILGRVTFNNDGGNNYATRSSANGAADGTSTSAALFNLDATSANAGDIYAVLYVINISDKEKLVIGSAWRANTAGDANAPIRFEIVVKWVNTTDQITRIDINNSGAGSFDTGSILKVWGSD